MKKANLMTIAAGLFFVCGALGQTTFERTYGGIEFDAGNSGQQTTDGGYVIAGQTISFGPSAGNNNSVYLIKTDGAGDTLWTRTYGSEETDVGSSVQQTSDGGYIIAGHTGTYPEFEVYLIKTDVSGNTVWEKEIGGLGPDFGNSVQQTVDGGYIVAGYTGVSDIDIYVVKTDASGDTLWTKTYGGAGQDYGNSVKQTSDGGFIIAGYSNSFSSSNSTYLIKTDNNGNTQWTHSYLDINENVGNSVQQTTDGGYIVTGNIGSWASGYDIYLIKTDDLGEALWTSTLGSTADVDNFGNSVQQTSDGGYIITGYSGLYTSYDVYLVKTDISGNAIWDRTLGGPNDDYGRYVQQTTDGGYVIVGLYEYSVFNMNDVYLIKTNENGMLTGFITGNVFLDGGSGNVEDVEVTAGSIVVNPDAYGDYTIGIEPGTYDVIGTLAGYEPDTVTDVVVTEGSTTSNIDLVLTYCVGIENNIAPGSEPLSNFPNPFNYTTTIKFTVENPDKNTEITIYSLNGQKIKTLVDAKQPQGAYNVIWDGTNEIGEKVSLGIYFCTMKTGNIVHTRKMILIK